MANIVFAGGEVPLARQTVTVNGAVDLNLWCSGINYSAGLGATAAEFVLPFKLADEVADRYQYKKVTVRTDRLLFVGYLPGRSEDISESTDGVTMTARSAGAFLNKIGVGEELNQWHYKYPLFDDATGALTGWTPAGVLLDLFDRLPERWKSEIALGNMDAITEAFDLPVQNYDFSLSTYQGAIEAVVGSLGDVAVRERFAGGRCLLDFVRISDPAAPKKRVVVAEHDARPDANVASYQPMVTGDEALNRVVAFGMDKEFMVTCRSVVDGLPHLSEPPNELEQYPTALLKDWDPALEAIVKADPKLATSDKVNRGCQIAGDNDPGTAGATFPIEVGIDLIPMKTVLVHPPSTERMLVTAFTPKTPADPEAEPPVEASPAMVTVTRMYQASEEQEAGDLKKGNPLTIEVPGISNVYRRYRLPLALQAHPKREVRSDLPIIDTQTGERVSAQVFIYPSTLTVDAENDAKKLGNIMHTPKLMHGGNKDFDKYRIHLDKPALVPVAVEKVDGKQRVTYAETVVGVTFAYVDPRWPFGWDTGVTDEVKIDLPWEVHTERLRLTEFVYWQTTNQGWPIETAAGEVVFGCLFINPRNGDVTTGYSVLRSDLAYLRTAAERLLMERSRRHVSAGVTLPWLDTGYNIGDRLEVQGLRNQPEELLTITQVGLTMDPDGAASTSITVDNVKPPARKRFNTKFNRAL